MGYIYCITNTKTNKVYIGKSIRAPKERVEEHFKEWELLNTDTKLTRAILKYGSNVWAWKIVEECQDNILSEREKHWISVYDSYKNGYNSTLGGDGNQRYIFDREDIFNKYKMGISAKNIASEYGCHYHYIHEVLQEFGIDTSEKQGKPKPIACFDRNMSLIDIFNTKQEIQDYLIPYGYGNSLGNVAHFISKACKTGKLTYKRYWKSITKENINEIINLVRCGINEYAGDNELNRALYIEERNKQLKIRTNNTCTNCGKLIGANSTSMLCKSCAQVSAKGKSPKPSKEELQALLAKGLQVKQIAELYDRNTSTVSTWIKSYNIR